MQFFQKNTAIFLVNSKKSTTFAADLMKIISRLERQTGRGGGIGRHEGLKILWPVMAVRVQVPPAVQQSKKVRFAALFFVLSCRENAHSSCG